MPSGVWRGALAAILLSLIPSAVLAEARVLVLQGSQLPPYLAVEKSFSDALGLPVKSINLASAESKQTLRTYATDGALTLAIGPDAARAALEVKPKGVVLYALVPNLPRVGLDPRAPHVSMFVSPQSQLKTVKLLLPAARRVGVVFDPSLTGPVVDECARAASAMGYTLVRSEVTEKAAVAQAVRDLIVKVDAILLLPDTTVVSADTLKFMLQLSLEQKRPLIGFSEGIARAGALASVEVGYTEIGVKAAEVTRRVLAGGSAGVEVPDSKLILNAKTAELLGVPISNAARAQAAKVIE